MKIILPLALATATACTHTQQYRPDPRAFAGTSADVVLADGSRAHVRGEARGGEIVWTGERGEIDPTEIRAVERTNRGIGAIEGLGLGILIGGSTGALIGFADGDDPPCEGLCFFQYSAGQKAAIGAFGLGLVGGLLGVVVGLAVGSTDRYEVRPAPGGAQLSLSF